MKNDIARTSIGRVALLSSRPILALVAAMFVADLLGSMGWVQGRIEGATLFYVFGNPISNWGVVMTLLIWMLTTGIQMVSSGMAYRAGTNPYMAGVGFYVWLFGSILSRTSLKFNRTNYGSVFTIEYGKLAKEWSGLAFLIALYWPSQLFDMATDASFYLTTPLRAFNLFFAFSSLVSEQLAYMASAAKSLETKRWRRYVVTYKTLMQQDRGWGLVCQMSVAPLVAGTLEWLIAVCAFWFIGAHYLAPWTWLAHLAAAYPLGGPAMWLRVGALAWAGWAFMRSGIDWATLAVFLWILLIPALTQLPHRWGGWAGRTAAYGLAFWFLLQMDHIAGLIGLVGLLLVLL